MYSDIVNAGISLNRYVGLDRFLLCKRDNNARRDNEYDPNNTQCIGGYVPKQPAEITDGQ